MHTPPQLTRRALLSGSVVSEALPWVLRGARCAGNGDKRCDLEEAGGKDHGRSAVAERSTKVKAAFDPRSVFTPPRNQEIPQPQRSRTV